ncbi:hypothetical protein GCM10010129_57530 [Streptomyces fumigatiscleroticus]|nr:hypothetical protein GCM10010129_57530 [Streptomyces fumigatiscleroticus]
MLAALRSPEPRTPDQGQYVAVRVGPCTPRPTSTAAGSVPAEAGRAASPEDVGMACAGYGVHVEACRQRRHRLHAAAPRAHTQTWLAFRDVGRLNA